jgi:hypothetical protein
MTTGISTRPPDATFKNGRWELPRSARGVLVLADPPEAGWRLEPHPDAHAQDQGHVAAGWGDERARERART